MIRIGLIICVLTSADAALTAIYLHNYKGSICLRLVEGTILRSSIIPMQRLDIEFRVTVMADRRSSIVYKKIKQLVPATIELSSQTGDNRNQVGMS